jgi:hypothetical protein
MRDAHPRHLGLRPWPPPFLLGFLASAFQIYLLREFAAEFYGSELIFGLFLGSWLFWGGVGSLIRPGGKPETGPARLARLYGLPSRSSSPVCAEVSHKLMGLHELTTPLPLVPPS